MKVAITHPTTFDRVRRGTERFVHELARYLAGRGHEVTVIACKPGRRERIRKDGYVQDSHRRWWAPFLRRVGVLESHAFLASTFYSLMTNRYDVVQCCSFTDAYAAQLAARFTGVPSAFFVNAIPPRVKYYRSVSLGGSVFQSAVRGADELIPISRYVQAYCEERFGRAGSCLPVPVDVDSFAYPDKQLTHPPVLACTAALDDRRKGGNVLMRAFNRVKLRIPDLILEVWCELPSDVQDALAGEVEPQFRDDVRFMGPGAVEGLREVYGRATATVLPSV